LKSIDYNVAMAFILNNNNNSRYRYFTHFKYDIIWFRYLP